MGKYKLINNVLGWIVFAIASTVYLMTMEPTASFWDCGEFISSAYKLEVGHPPGAPFFMLTANLFTQLASAPSTVAKMVNTMSALFSGLTILFLFWSITHLARKIMVKDGEEASLGQMITVMGSGLVGALAYTFSDTFWFSARKEGERKCPHWGNSFYDQSRGQRCAQRESSVNRQIREVQDLVGDVNAQGHNRVDQPFLKDS